MSWQDLVKRRGNMASETDVARQQRVGRLTKGLMQQMRSAGIPVLEMLEIGDAIVVTVAKTVIEVAEPGEQREKVRAELLAIVDRIRADIEGSNGDREGNK